MKAFYLTVFAFVAVNATAQVEEAEPVETVEKEEVTVETIPPDTTRIKIGKREVIIIGDEVKVDDDFEDEFEPEDEKPSKENNEAHWAGLDFGFNAILSDNVAYDPYLDPYHPNDVAASQVWNLNILEHKFNIVKEYVGITTGLGFNFTQIGIRNNMVLEKADVDGLFIATQDTLVNYKKNKLRATYLTVPVLLEFNTSRNNDKGFYFAAGVVGGYRIASSYKRVYEVEGDTRKSKQKGGYNLNPFKLDATARLGYGSFGAFVTYGLTSLLEYGPQDGRSLTAGLTLNF